jgi:hypothetical protein
MRCDARAASHTEHNFRQMRHLHGRRERRSAVLRVGNKNIPGTPRRLMTLSFGLLAIAMTGSVRAVIDRRRASLAINEPNPTVRTDGQLRLRRVLNLSPRSRSLRESRAAKSERSSQKETKGIHKIE